MKSPGALRSLLPYLEVAWSGPLVEMGWYRTRASRLAVDTEGRPIPWFTYAAIAFLESRVLPGVRVFEYGCGFGTLWWAKRAVEVIAVEHDRGWANHIGAQLPAHARIAFARSEDMHSYVGAIGCTGALDVVVVDGEHRAACASAAAKALSPRGVIVWDDSQRPEYQSGLRQLAESGFRRIAFAGIAPVSKHLGETSVFYRDNNLLDI